MNAVAPIPRLDPTLGPDALVPDPDALALLGVRAARRHDVLPLGLDPARGTLVLATPAPSDVLRRDAVRALVDRRVALEWRGAEPRFVTGALARLEALGTASAGAVPAGTPAADAAGDDAAGPVDALLHAAVAARASDLHLTPEPGGTRVRHRVDGVLRDVPAPLAARHAALAVRLKVMARLDVAECRLPQDGGFRRLVRARTVDFRLSSFPCTDGENLVLRVLDASVRPPGLDALGLDPATGAALTALVERPGGLVVVAGPTGSGKSTTLHALVRTLVGRGLAIHALEDPVEHRVEGVCQTSIDPARGLDHASGVRALLRQDPDVLLIGEMRDAPGVRTALRAAAAGHRVLTTVHADDALGALERLVELGAGDALVVRAALARVLTGVAAQRLVGRPCASCDGAGRADCPSCGGRGLAGRFALVELLRIAPDVADALRRDAPPAELAAAAGRAGFVPLAGHARAAVARGATVRAEVLRTLGDAWEVGS